MPNFLDLLRPKKEAPKKPGGKTLTAYSAGGAVTRPIREALSKRGPLPRAAAIYGGAAAVFAVITVFYLFRGQWITGLIMILPTACLAGFAWQYMKE